MSQVKAIVDKLLTKASNMIVPTGFVAEQVLPAIYSTQKTGKLGTYGNGHLRLESTIAGGRGEFRRVDAITRSTSTYSIDVHGLEAVVSPDDYLGAEEPFDAEEDEVIGLTTLLQLKKEYSLASALTSSSIMTNYSTLSGVEQYSDYANSDPLDDANTAANTIRDAIGAPPNIAIMDWKVYKKLRFHPQLLAQLGYTQARPGGLTGIELANALDVERVLIANAVYNSAKEGATDVITPVWGKHLVYAYCPASAGKRQKTLGYRMQLADQKRSQRAVYKYAINNPPGSTGIIVQDNWDFFLADVTAGYLFRNVIA